MSLVSTPSRSVVAQNRWNETISVKEVLLSSVVLVVLGAVLVKLLLHYPYYDCCFQQISAGVRHWDFRGLGPTQPKEFWGFSYLAALVAAITRLPDIYAIVVVSSSMFVLANYLCSRLWGTLVGIWFVVIDWWYIDGAVEGLTEPLFVALLLGSFLAIRKEKWALAALLAAGATVVRPAGVFALLALGILLLMRKNFRQLAVAMAIAFVVGVGYLIPMKLIYGDMLANVHGYHREDWSGPFPVSIPLLPVIRGASMSHRWWLQILIGAWVLFTVAGLIKMAVDKRFWSYAKQYPAEAFFAGFFGLFLLSYNVPYWSWLHFPRFAVPLVPFLILVFVDRFPRDRRIIWAVGLFNVAVSVWLKVHP
jgi:hypothetical protein